MASPDKINLGRLSYVIYEHTKLDEFTTFAGDFGFELESKHDDGTHYFRGYGPDPFAYVARKVSAPGVEKAFRGSGFTARAEEDFDRACKLDGARVIDVSKRPGGGRMVSVPDVNGFEIQIVFGQTERIVPSNGLSRVTGGQPNVNGAVNKVRKGLFNRMTSGPAKIHKLGHFGYMTDNYLKTCEWYSSNFNFKATDIVHLPEEPGSEIMTFYHLDLGQEYSDHHCLLVAQRHGGAGTNIHHSSFEVEDMDTQMMGHQYLQSKDYRLMWGVGRHVLGSQIFDYWYDSSGFIIEHYADGDVVNEDTPTTKAGGTPAAIWGPPLPKKWD